MGRINHPEPRRDQSCQIWAVEQLVFNLEIIAVPLHPWKMEQKIYHHLTSPAIHSPLTLQYVNKTSFVYVSIFLVELLSSTGLHSDTQYRIWGGSPLTLWPAWTQSMCISLTGSYLAIQLTSNTFWGWNLIFRCFICKCSGFQFFFKWS